jgi:hypothetical protein
MKGTEHPSIQVSEHPEAISIIEARSVDASKSIDVP